MFYTCVESFWCTGHVLGGSKERSAGHVFGGSSGVLTERD